MGCQHRESEQLAQMTFIGIIQNVYLDYKFIKFKFLPTVAYFYDSWNQLPQNGSRLFEFLSKIRKSIGCPDSIVGRLGPHVGHRTGSWKETGK